MQKVITKQDLGFTYNSDIIIKKHKQSYEKWKWIVLIGCFLLQMFPYCVSVNLSKVFAPEWLYWLNGDSSWIGIGYTIATVVSSFVGPFIAKLFNKQISMRFIYGLGVSAACLGFATFGINALIPNISVPWAVTFLWSGNVISQIGLVIFSGLGINNLISRWWPDNKRGFAFGVAFAGGSIGNIWMQPLLAKLTEVFNNIPTVDSSGLQIYQPPGQEHLQYLTYFIFAAIGLVFGLTSAMIICRKQIAPTYVFEQEVKAAVESQKESVSLLNTKKYPPYWILCIGFMLMQMSSVQSAQSSTILNYYVLTGANRTADYKTFTAYTGIVYGVSCLFGNFGGSMLSQKLKPNNGILIGGLLQILAMIIMLYSVVNPELVYLYYVLQGLAAFMYTSIKSILCGNLYGKQHSNSHIAILGLFVGIGFALTNSLYGVVLGNTKTDITYFMGYETKGNAPALLFYCIGLLSTGMILAYFASIAISKRGIKGMIEYSPTKYSEIILWKHSFMINLTVLFLKWFNIDLRQNKWLIKRHQKKMARFTKVTNGTSKQSQAIEHCLKHTNFVNEKLDKKLSAKVEKLNSKIQIMNKEEVDLKKQSKLKQKSIDKITKYTSLREQLLNTPFDNQWKMYQKEYRYLEQIEEARTLETKLQDKLDAKKQALQKKIGTVQYVTSFEKEQHTHGYELLKDYYNNPYEHVNKLVDKKLSDIATKKQKAKNKA